MEELLGQQLGKFTIERMLGRGGMAAVFLAHDAEMERNVAIKVLPRDFANDPSYLQRFQREVKTIARLNHPNIVPVFDYGEAQGWTYIVMAHMPGGTLHGRIRKMGNSIPLETIVGYMEQIGSAVDYAHAQGIIHRDFKPANVLLGDGGHLALSDFGIAKVAESTAQLTGTGMLGTPAYMAPEMANRDGLTKSVDIYAVGVSLYELVTGSTPFDATTPMGQLMAHLSTPVPDARYFRTDLPDGVQAVIEQAMAKDPKQRYQSASAIAADLREAVGAAPGYATEGYERVDDGSTFVAPPKAQTPSQPTARPPLRTAAQTLPAAAQTMPAAGKRGPNIGAIAGVAALVVALAVAALVLTGVLSPGRPAAQTTATSAAVAAVVESPTATLAVSPTPVSLQPITSLLFGNAEIKKDPNSAFKPMAGGEVLSAGATIKTGADGAVLLTFAEGVSTEIHPGSVVTIKRLEVVGDTLFIELIQDSGTTYHFISKDSSGQKRDYSVHTPRGTLKATGTQFWVDEASEGWYYIPTDGTTSFDLNDSGDTANAYVEHAANHDCILVDADSKVSNCQKLPDGLTLLTDGSSLKATDTPTPVVVVNAPQATATSAATATTAVAAAQCGPGWLPAAGCSCCGTTKVCADGTVAQFNPACGIGGGGGGGGGCYCDMVATHCSSGCSVNPGAGCATPGDCH